MCLFKIVPERLLYVKINRVLGQTEPVHCLSLYRDQIISGTTGNRIGVHAAVDSQVRIDHNCVCSVRCLSLSTHITHCSVAEEFRLHRWTLI